jgi:hypothetical protein
MVAVDLSIPPLLSEVERLCMTKSNESCILSISNQSGNQKNVVRNTGQDTPDDSDPLYCCKN